MSQTYGIEAPDDAARRGAPHRPAARYLVMIDPVDQATALLFTESRAPAGEFAAGSEEVAVMTRGLQPGHGADDPVWDTALGRYDSDQRRAALVYTLDV